MARNIFALLGAALVLIGSFFLSLKLFDYFGVFTSSAGPTVSLTVEGKDSIVISRGSSYKYAYTTSGALSCDMRYRSDDDGSSGHFPVPPNAPGTGASALIGSYTLTCTGADGVTASRTVRITATPK
jgi:hypothetical protein